MVLIVFCEMHVIFKSYSCILFITFIVLSELLFSFYFFVSRLSSVVFHVLFVSISSLLVVLRLSFTSLFPSISSIFPLCLSPASSPPIVSPSVPCFPPTLNVSGLLLFAFYPPLTSSLHPCLLAPLSPSTSVSSFTSLPFLFPTLLVIARPSRSCLEPSTPGLESQ